MGAIGYKAMDRRPKNYGSISFRVKNVISLGQYIINGISTNLFPFNILVSLAVSSVSSAEAVRAAVMLFCCSLEIKNINEI
jgi:hypothetical protein